MEPESVFDRLTRTLTQAERTELLNRVKALGLLAEVDGLGDEETATAAAPHAEELRLGLLSRLLLFFMSLFTGKPRAEVLHDMAMRRLGEEVQRAAPGLLDARRSVFLGKARDAIQALAAALDQLREPLRAALGEEQEAFVAFLTGHLLPHVQETLDAVIDVDGRSADLFPLEVAEARRRVHEELDTAMQSIPEPERRGVYADVRALHRLRGLATFPYGEITGCFDAEGAAGECSFGRLKKLLPALDAQLAASRRPPSSACLEGLAMFARREEIGSDGFDMKARLTEDLAKASTALAALRAFDRNVPLTRIVRLVTGNLDYQPRAVGGGEDWFVLFKRYWTARADKVLKEFARRQELRRLAGEAERYLGVHRLPRSGAEEIGGVVGAALEERELALAIVVGFSQEVYSKLSRTLRGLVERARFVKEENRRELAEVCAFLDGLDARLDSLVGTLRVEQERGEAKGDSIARASLEERAARSLDGFLDESAAKIKLLASLVEGVLRGVPGSRFDTVFNLDTLADWQGRVLTEVLEDGFDRISEGLALVGRARAV